MSIAVRAVSGLTAGTTTAAAWTHPTGSAVSDGMLAAFACKPYTADIASGTFLTDYALVGNGTNGTVANGVDVGSVRCHVRFREFQSGDTAPAGTVSAAPSPRMVAMMALTRGGTGWDVAGTTGGDSDTSGTSVSITGASDPGIEAGDHVVVYVAMPSDGGNPPSSATITVPGCTVGTVTRQQTTRVTTSGNDGALVAYEAPISSGTSSGAPSITFTAGTSGFSSATAVFVRLRETTGGSTLLGEGTVTVTPTVSGSGYKLHTGTGAVTVTPSVSGDGSVIRDPVLGEGTVTVTPTVSGEGTTTPVVIGAGVVTVTPAVSGAGYATVVGSGAAVVVPPVVDGTASVADATWVGSGSVVVVPVVTGSGFVSVPGSTGTVSVAPVVFGYGRSIPAGGFIMAAAQLADARALWADATTLDDGQLGNLLESAWAACLAYLPAEVVDAPGFAPGDVPGYVQANVLHARDLFTAYRQEGGVVGFDTYAVRVRPLSDTVRSLLRPRRGIPAVG